MDPLLRQFHRQYLQQVSNVTIPSPKLLSHIDIQRQLQRYFFDNTVDPYLPPPEYQRKILKKLVTAIIGEAKDENDEVSDDLMAHMAYLSSVPKQPELDMAQTSRVLSYSLPDLPQSATSITTYENSMCDEHCCISTCRRILIQERPQLLASGSSVGHRTWEACLRLAYYLATSKLRSKLKGANVLELGAGTGLLSIVCSMGLHANLVLATDGLTGVVNNIQENISLNAKQPRSQEEPMDMPLARILDWTDLSNLDDLLSTEAKNLNVDYILGADITYHPELLDPLASLLRKLSDRFPSCRILISATVRNEHTFRLWTDACNSQGLVIRDLDETEDQWTCPPYWLQTGLFHEQAFPIVIMDIRRDTQRERDPSC